MFTFLKRFLKLGNGKPNAGGVRGRFSFRNKFDAASSGGSDQRHWLQADSLSPNAAVNVNVRKKIRERSRYEVANNPVAFGAVNARVHDLIGTGPRLQLSLPEPDDVTDEQRQDAEAKTRQVEEEFGKWTVATKLADALRQLERAKIIDGESFALKITNEKITHPVKLQLRPFECDRVCDPRLLTSIDPLYVDGIQFDTAGNPVTYTILRQHPGDRVNYVLQEYDEVPADQVYHFFRADRPGQERGVSWLTPALRLFGYLREYTLAVLGAAQTAANIHAIMTQEQDLGAIDEDETEDYAPFVGFDIARGIMGLPPGRKVEQLRAEQPTTQFGDFRREIFNEIGRCLDMPLNIVIGNSTSYNFSSGRLDHRPYHRKLWVEREQLAEDHLNRLFLDWLDEAVPAGLVPDGLPPIQEWRFTFNWDGLDTSGDPVKESQAAQLDLSLKLTTLSEQCAARGLRWQDVLLQLRREQDYAERIGLKPTTAPVPVPAPVPVQQPPTTTDTQPQRDDTDDTEEAEDREEVRETQ